MEEDRRGKRRRERLPVHPDRAKGFYWQLDTCTEFLIYAILIFTPWAFGTTETWAINTVNMLNYFLGGLLVAKWLMRLAGFKCERWDGSNSSSGWHPYWITGPLFALTIGVLGYCALAAWNARAQFIPQEQRFEYFDAIGGLPQSYDQARSWGAFRLYLAAACFFWALRDWLVTKSPRDLWAEAQHQPLVFVGPELARSGEDGRHQVRIPTRLKRLCWVVTINAAILAFEGTLQRLSGTRDLLWLVRPMFNDTAAAQFGPFNYRSNGAQYLNLIWPLALAFWWSLHHHSRSRFGAGAEFILLPAIGLILAGPIIASSRGGIAIAAGQILAVMAIFAYAFRRTAWKIGVAAAILIVIFGLGIWLQWDFLLARLNENTLNTMSGRTEIYANAERIVEDFPVWGTGPGTFAPVYQLYRADPTQIWYAHAHNDYLQTIITFGRVGFTLIGAMLIATGAYWFLARGIRTSVFFVSALWVALAGCLMHARFDFPFQIYAILLIVLTNCAILTVLSRR
ncbi:MAG TPA: O-antigen ligase family protein [Pyrinomonadaceae bacterium]|nr:O-antigen ligase family protein [Pyrinomonadaceae bacterium]